MREAPKITQEIESGFDSLFKKIGSTDRLSEWSDKFDILADACNVTDKNFIGFLKTTQESGTSYKNAEDAIAGYQAYLKKAGNESVATTIKTKALSGAMKLVSSAGWMLLITGITWIAEKAIGAIDNSIHAAERCKERVDELMDSYNSALNTANSNAKTAESLASRYELLSKGVNNIGENISLTTSEYAEYNDIVNQIANMFPNLIKGYTEQQRIFVMDSGLDKRHS